MGTRDGTGSTSWRGSDGGPRQYRPDQYRLVVETMKEHHVGKAKATKQSALMREGVLAQVFQGYDGRTIRAILREADGVEFVLGGGDEGVFVADNWEETEGMHDRLKSQAATMMSRVERRATYRGKHLARAQPRLHD
jgi:hypothetical protein